MNTFIELVYHSCTHIDRIAQVRNWPHYIESRRAIFMCLADIFSYFCDTQIEIAWFWSENLQFNAINNSSTNNNKNSYNNNNNNINENSAWAFGWWRELFSARIKSKMYTKWIQWRCANKHNRFHSNICLFTISRLLSHSLSGGTLILWITEFKYGFLYLRPTTFPHGTIIHYWPFSRRFACIYAKSYIQNGHNHNTTTRWYNGENEQK